MGFCFVFGVYVCVCACVCVCVCVIRFGPAMGTMDAEISIPSDKNLELSLHVA